MRPNLVTAISTSVLAFALLAADPARAQNTPAAYRTYGSGCAGSNGTPTASASAAPIFGSSFTLDLANARSNSLAMLLLGAQRQQVPLGLVGAPGCELLVQPFGSFSSATDAQGQAALELTIPNDLSLMGLTLPHQWGVVDPVNALGVVTSNGGEMTIGVGAQIQVSNVIGPTSGRIGSVIRIVGRNFGDDAGDYCIRGEDANGASVLFVGRGIVHLPNGGDELHAELVAAPTSPMPTQIKMMRGQGIDVPDLPGAPVADAFAWNGLSFVEHGAVVFTFTPVVPRSTSRVFVIRRPAGASHFEVRFPQTDPLNSGNIRWAKGTRLSANFDWNMGCGVGATSRNYDGWFEAKTLVRSLTGVEVGDAIAAQIEASFNARFSAGDGVTTSVVLDGTDVVVEVRPTAGCTLSISPRYGKLTISPPVPVATEVVGLVNGLGFSRLEAVGAAIGTSVGPLPMGLVDVAASEEEDVVATVSGTAPATVEGWDWEGGPVSLGTVALPIDFTNVRLEMAAKTPGTGARFALAFSSSGDERVFSVQVSPTVSIRDVLTLPEPIDELAISPNGQFVVASQARAVAPPTLSKFVFNVDPVNPGVFSSLPRSTELVFSFTGTSAKTLEFNPIGEQLLAGIDDGMLVRFNVTPLPAGGFSLSQAVVEPAPLFTNASANAIQFSRDCTRAFVLYADFLGVQRLLVEYDIDPSALFLTTRSGRDLVVAGGLATRTPMGAIEGGDELVLGVGGNYHLISTDGLVLDNHTTLPTGANISAIAVLGR